MNIQEGFRYYDDEGSTIGPMKAQMRNLSGEATMFNDGVNVYNSKGVKFHLYREDEGKGNLIDELDDSVQATYLRLDIEELRKELKIAKDLSEKYAQEQAGLLELLRGNKPVIKEKANLPESDYTENDISTEEYREYDFLNSQKYRIEAPVTLITRKGGSGHRIIDAEGVTHWVPVNVLYVLRWYAPDEPVSF